MKVCYYALVSFDDYAVGDLIPGAVDWPFISGYVSEGKVAPVLVATLPADVQEALAALSEAEEAEEEDDEQEANDGGLDGDTKSYEDLTVEQLKTLLDDRGVEHASHMKKADLIDLVILSEEDPTPEVTE